MWLLIAKCHIFQHFSPQVIKSGHLQVLASFEEFRLSLMSWRNKEAEQKKTFPFVWSPTARHTPALVKLAEEAWKLLVIRLWCQSKIKTCTFPIRCGGAGGGAGEKPSVSGYFTHKEEICFFTIRHRIIAGHKRYRSCPVHLFLRQQSLELLKWEWRTPNTRIVRRIVWKVRDMFHPENSVSRWLITQFMSN